MHGQEPIESGFSHESTATEVLEGIALSGKTVVITGGHSGIGLESTKAFSAAGATVIIGARNVETAREAVASIPNTSVLQLDLTNLDSVKHFADTLIDSSARVDIILCNAGIMACPEARVGAGWESQFATNHLGHFALVNRLWPQLNPGARVVCVSSAAHHLSPIRWDDLHFTGGSYDKWLAYGQSKTANALFALQLDEYGRERGIRAFSVHPGKILTPLQRHLERGEMVLAGWVDSEGKLVDSTFKTPEQGAATQVWAATSPRLSGLGGLYCEDCNIAELHEPDLASFRGVCHHAHDFDEAARLWALSATLTGVNAFECGAPTPSTGGDTRSAATFLSLTERATGGGRIVTQPTLE